MSPTGISRTALAAVSCLLITVTGFALSGCVLTPRGTAAERERLAEAGAAWEPPPEERALPELPASPDWPELLRHAFLANGDLEAAYFEWKASLATIDVEAGWPNSNVMLGYDYMFSPGQMKAWDRSTVRVGFDPMQNVSLPPKVMVQGRIALEQARAAGQRFESAKFALQRQVLEEWFEFAATAERLRLAREDADLTSALAGAATARLEAGAAQRTLVEADMARISAEDEIRRLEADVSARRARLNALAGRASDAPLDPPAALPPPRPLTAPDDVLLAMAVDANPELAALASEVAGRDDALDWARLQYLPDINPFVVFSGNSVQAVGTMISLSTQLPQIWGRIDQAKAMLRAGHAELEQRHRDRGADFVATLVLLRDSERQIELLERQLLPAAEAATGAGRVQYEGGTLELADLIGAERAPLQVRALAAEARALREARLAALEELAGVDVETLAPVTTASTEGGR
jgi:outer membrane protein TolC